MKVKDKLLMIARKSQFIVSVRKRVFFIVSLGLHIYIFIVNNPFKVYTQFMKTCVIFRLDMCRTHDNVCYSYDSVKAKDS